MTDHVTGDPRAFEGLQCSVTDTICFASNLRRCGDASTRRNWYRQRKRTGPPQGRSTRHGAFLVVKDYWQPAIDAGCGFVHLGQEGLDTTDIAAIRKAAASASMTMPNSSAVWRSALCT
ncbi:MAG: hypothetical protein OXQ84_21495 [bacterium]|nr:hypothetical protein [bacterium]